MSETTSAPATEAPETAAEFLEGVAGTSPAQAAEVVTETPPETTETPAEPPKPDKVERRIANLTRKMGEESRRAAAAEARAEAAERRLNTSEPDAAPAPQRPVDVETRAGQLVEEREFNRRLNEIDSAGKKEFGGDSWEAAKTTLTGLGATSNKAFLEALAEAENPSKLFAHFADDTDELLALLEKPAAAMAAKIGRLDAQMSKPVTRPLSAAPAPAPKIRASGVVPEANPHNYPANMSMKEWTKMMDAHLPPSLGGKKKLG